MTTTADPVSPDAAPQPPRPPEHNWTGVDFRRPMPRPKARGRVIDIHCHLLAARHGQAWFEAARHYGIDTFFSMNPLEEALGIQRDWGGRVHFIAVPKWQDPSLTGDRFIEDWERRIEAFYNLGSRIAKFHVAPGTIASRGWRLDDPALRPVFNAIYARGMAIMTHVGDPDTWYHGKYAKDVAKYGVREDHYKMWETMLAQHPKELPWIGAHMGGNPENLPRLQSLLDRYSNLYLDCSATRWIVREISKQREAAREFFIRNADRILFGSDQVSGDDRGFDFLASRFWAHRKLWETAFIGQSPIFDPDLAEDGQPVMHGLALPDEVLQKLYRDNAVKVMGKVGVGLE